MSESDSVGPTGRDVAEARAVGQTWEQIGARYGLDYENVRGRWRRWKRKHPDDWKNLKKQTIAVAAPVIEGLFPADLVPDAETLWQQAITAQRQAAALAARRNHQTITINDRRPIGVALLSDAHVGGPGTDYEAMRRDAEIIRDTDGLYAADHGDGIDNWIVGRLTALQRGQVIGFNGERELFFSWLDMMGDKLLWLIAGNHAWWTYELAGVDVFVERLRGRHLLYDPHEVYLTLTVGGASWRILARHKWRYGSVFNATHGIEVGWERRGLDFDIGIGGHTHTGTLCREFVRHDRKRYAVQIGTYKVDDGFGREIGAAPPHGRGCGAMIFYPDGRLHWCAELETAAKFLAMERGA